LVDGGSANCDAVEEIEVWPSGVALRGEASNRPHLHWLKTVVENVVGKGATRSRQVWVGKMSDGRRSSAVDVSKVGKMTSKPGLHLGPGISLGVTRLLPRRRPAYRQHEPDLGSFMERVKAGPDTAAGFPRREGGLQAAESARSRVPSPGTLADSLVVAGKLPRIAAGVEPRGGVVQAGGTRSTAKGGIACMSRR